MEGTFPRNNANHARRTAVYHIMCVSLHSLLHRFLISAALFAVCLRHYAPTDDDFHFMSFLVFADLRSLDAAAFRCIEEGPILDLP